MLKQLDKIVLVKTKERPMKEHNLPTKKTSLTTSLKNVSTTLIYCGVLRKRNVDRKL